MDRLIAGILRHHGVSIPHLVAETAHHRLHHNLHEFAARPCHSSTVRREAILRSLPPTMVPLSITVGTRPRGLVRVRKLQLDRWNVLGVSSKIQTTLMITNHFMPVTMEESLIGRPLNSIIDSPFIDSRPVKRVAKYTLEGHKGTAFMVDTEHEEYSSHGEIYSSQDNISKNQRPFRDKHGKQWNSLAQLLAEAEEAPCRAVKRNLIALSVHDVEVYGGKPCTVISVRPQSNNSKNPQVYLTGSFFDFIFKGWIIPCEKLEPGELVTMVRAAKSVVLD